MYAPLIVGEGVRVREGQDVASSLRVRNLALPEGVGEAQADTRLDLLKYLEDDFVASRPGITGRSHQNAYRQAVRMMNSGASNAFSFETEPEEPRERYGMNPFGQGCLLARRLVEQGVPFIEVTMSNAPGAEGGIGWDTHQGNFPRVQALSADALCGARCRLVDSDGRPQRSRSAGIDDNCLDGRIGSDSKHQRQPRT